jgi:hypothetical protein
VDEAAPPAALRRFALLNLNSARNLGSQGGALSFWGNIRFERAFTRDLADFLCYAGLTGVSAGIEIATGNGLAAIGKGTDIQTVVSACAAFREAGVLVHGYMIYGYWEETPQELIDSAETLRQLFAAGLISSAFWHKFVLTRHSRVYSEWRQGLHPKLCPQEPESGDAVFADNDICFKGEERSSRYGVPLDNALAAWMAGEDLDLPVRSWFPFPMPSPSVPEDLAEQCIMAYERERDRAFKSEPRAGEQYIWIGGSPVVTGQGKSRLLSWMYMGEEVSVELAAKTSDSAARRLRELKAAAARGETCDGAELGLEGTLLAALRGRGLCKVGTGSK